MLRDCNGATTARTLDDFIFLQKWHFSLFSVSIHPDEIQSLCI